MLHQLQPIISICDEELFIYLFIFCKNYYHQSSAKMAKYLFLTNFPAKYSLSETI